MEWEWTLKVKEAPKRNTPYRPFYNLEETQDIEKGTAKTVRSGGKLGKMLKLRAGGFNNCEFLIR